MVCNHIIQPDMHKKGPNGICSLMLDRFTAINRNNMNKIPETEEKRINKGRSCHPIQAPNALINFTSPQPMPMFPLSFLYTVAIRAVVKPPVTAPNTLSWKSILCSH